MKNKERKTECSCRGKARIQEKHQKMELIKAETEPISLAHPTYEENQKTEALEHYLQ